MTTLAPTLRVYEYWLMQYRRIWRGTVITSIVNPVFYLGALGVGLGSLVNKSGGQPLGVPPLADLIAFVCQGVAPSLIRFRAERIVPIVMGLPEQPLE